MAYQKGPKLRNYLLIKPKEASFLQFIRLLFSPNSNRISFIEFSEEEGQKLRESLLFRLIIIASAFVQKLLLKIRVPMAKIGDLLESLLNIITVNGGIIALLRNLTTGKVVLPTPIQSASVIGNLDTRVDLDKNITTDDDKYLGALTMMAAKLAYEDAAYVTNVVLFHWKMQFLGFYNYWNDYLGTFSTPVFLFQDAKINAKLVVVAFRGTDPFSADGWSTDIDLSYYEIENVGKVHRGFAKALGIIQKDNTMPSQLLEQNKKGIDLKPYAYYEIVKLLKGILLLNPKAKFIVTGHSLGGALSVMFAAALAMHGEADLLGKLQGVYTYGQPRVGDEQFGTYMEQKLSKYNLSYNRYVYSFDLVPRIPFDDSSFLYKHFGKCLFFNSLYKGKVLEDAPDKNYFSLIWYFPKLLNALWELIRSFINPHKYGPDYKEGWLQILFRLFGILVPGLSAHGPQDYVNLTGEGSDMSCGGGGGGGGGGRDDSDRCSCGKAGGVAVNLQRMSSIVRDIGEPCLSQSPIKVSVVASKMLKPEKWHAAFDSEGKIFCFQKALKRIVLGGVDPSIRPEVWEFLLGCYALGSTADYRRQLRTARREHYENLMKQCQMMHSSIGTGSLAYVVGSKVMDMRAPSSDNGITEPDTETKRSSVHNANKVEGTCYRNNDTVMSFACSESSSDSGDLISVRGSSGTAACESSLFKETSCSQNYNTLNLEREGDGSQGLYLDFPPLPVTDLFGKSEEDKKEGNVQNGKLSQHKLRCKDNRMHSFQINNNVDLVIELNTSPSNKVSHPVDSEIEMARADVREPILQSSNIDKKTEVVNRMRISDVPEADFVDGTLPQGEAVNKDRVSEWLWILHRIVVDVVRTDSHLEFYEDTRNLARMSDILAVYAWVDPATGYCQGMSDLLSPFIVLFEDDADAFWCFEMLLRRMRENFQMEGPTGVMKQLQALWLILELTDREMFAHLSHIGAESLHFAFRMLLVLFRRELPFNEALYMWEMMWAADFDESLVHDLEENCLEALVVELPRDSESEMRDESVESSRSTTKGSLRTNHENVDCSVTAENGIKSAATHHFCGLTRNIWSRNGTMQIAAAVSSTKRGDDELPVFCVAAILILNRQKIIRETRSIDDMIKIFNDKILKISVKRCVHTAIKLRKKYFYKLIKRKNPAATNGDCCDHMKN